MLKRIFPLNRSQIKHKSVQDFVTAFDFFIIRIIFRENRHACIVISLRSFIIPLVEVNLTKFQISVCFLIEIHRAVSGRQLQIIDTFLFLVVLKCNIGKRKINFITIVVVFAVFQHFLKFFHDGIAAAASCIIALCCKNACMKSYFIFRIFLQHFLIHVQCFTVSFQPLINLCQNKHQSDTGLFGFIQRNSIFQIINGGFVISGVYVVIGFNHRQQLTCRF
ncbi:hypothetical protein SDC9_68778 [bioreactor metagenome]|uniref:Uncharacterized protein n=1 Tax=bioreactor metagenome TaxID=1076179 RepID=A0A644Y1E8_9ZZZZ